MFWRCHSLPLVKWYKVFRRRLSSGAALFFRFILILQSNADHGVLIETEGKVIEPKDATQTGQRQ